MTELEQWAYNLGQQIGTFAYWSLTYLAIGAVVSAFFCGVLAHQKGYRAWVYAPLGLLFGPLVLLFLIGLPATPIDEARYQEDIELERERLKDAGRNNVGAGYTDATHKADAD